MKRILLLCLCFLSSTAFAEDYLLEVKEADKIIHIDELRLPSTATLEDAIYLLPEILGRPSYITLNNYDIEIDGFSIGNSKDAVMTNIHAYSIEKITISESPANSYNNNGQGGTIKIALKDPDKGLSGNADLAANTFWGVMPSAQLDYKNKKGNFSMHAFAMGEVLQTSTDYIRYRLDPIGQQKYVEVSDTTRKKYDTQLLRVYMKYFPNAKNKLEFLVSGERLSDGTWSCVEESNPVSDKDVKYNADANVKYTLFTDDKGSEFKVEAKFGYHPMDEFQDVLSTRCRQTYGKHGSLVGGIDYKGVFTKVLTMFFGTDYNFYTGSSDFTEQNQLFGHLDPEEYSTSTGSYYLSPHVRALVNFSNWSIKASAEYQFYNYAITATNIPEPFSRTRHDFTGSIFANWQVVPHHNLRFSAERKINRPTAYQMTPVWTFDTSSYEYIVGNENLQPMKVHNLGVDYITDLHTKHGLFTLNAGVNYMFVDDIIKRIFEPSRPTKGIPEYFTFENSGSAGILCGNLFLYYRSGMLTITAAANAFWNHTRQGGAQTNYSYYNLSLQPILTFPNDWVVSARAVWYGDISTDSSYLGGFSFAYLNVAKTWGHVTVGLNGQLPFPRYSLNTTIDDAEQKSYLYYRATYAYAGLKFSYRF